MKVSRKECKLPKYSSHGLFDVTQNMLEYVRPRLNVLGLAEVYRHSCKMASTVLF